MGWGIQSIRLHFVPQLSFRATLPSVQVLSFRKSRIRFKEVMSQNQGFQIRQKKEGGWVVLAAGKAAASWKGGAFNQLATEHYPTEGSSFA